MYLEWDASAPRWSFGRPRPRVEHRVAAELTEETGALERGEAAHAGSSAVVTMPLGLLWHPVRRD